MMHPRCNVVASGPDERRNPGPTAAHTGQGTATEQSPTSGMSCIRAEPVGRAADHRSRGPHCGSEKPRSEVGGLEALNGGGAIRSGIL